MERIANGFNGFGRRQGRFKYFARYPIVNLACGAARLGTRSTDYRYRRLEEIRNGAALTQKFRIVASAESLGLSLSAGRFEPRDEYFFHRSRNDRTPDDDRVIAGLIGQRLANLAQHMVELA